MASLNIAIICGNIGRDAETRYTQDQVAVTQFSVATTESWKDKSSDTRKEKTTWHNVVIWRRENLAQYLTKGTHVTVHGKIENRSYEKDGVTHYRSEIVADEIVLGGGGGQSKGGGSGAGWDGYSPAKSETAKPAAGPATAQQNKSNAWGTWGGGSQPTSNTQAASQSAAENWDEMAPF